MSADTTKVESSTDHESKTFKKHLRKFTLNNNYKASVLPHKPSNYMHGTKRRFPKNSKQMVASESVHNTAARIVLEKLRNTAGPTYDLPLQTNTDTKFSGRNRLYIGSVASNISDDDLIGMFSKYGETSEFFVNRDKNFGFVTFDYHYNAEKAKGELNGINFKGRILKIRFAPSSTIIKVKNLDKFVTNELLHYAFSTFGEVDRSIVIADDHGKSMREGIVEFSRRNSAQMALRMCNEQCFFLTSNLRPVYVEPYEYNDDVGGYSEKIFVRKTPEYYKSRCVGPRFSADTFEYECGIKWKRLKETYDQKLNTLKNEVEKKKEILVAQMEFSRYEYETSLLRKKLHERELDMDRYKKEWKLKQDHAEKQKGINQKLMCKQEENIRAHTDQKEQELHRQGKGNNLFLQAQEVTIVTYQEPATLQIQKTDKRSQMDVTTTTATTECNPLVFNYNLDQRTYLTHEGHWGSMNIDISPAYYTY